MLGYCCATILFRTSKHVYNVVLKVNVISCCCSIVDSGLLFFCNLVLFSLSLSCFRPKYFEFHTWDSSSNCVYPWFMCTFVFWYVAVAWMQAKAMCVYCVCMRVFELLYKCINRSKWFPNVQYESLTVIIIVDTAENAFEEIKLWESKRDTCIWESVS